MEAVEIGIGIGTSRLAVESSRITFDSASLNLSS
jgi:hypothetical protein